MFQKHLISISSVIPFHNMPYEEEKESAKG